MTFCWVSQNTCNKPFYLWLQSVVTKQLQKHITQTPDSLIAGYRLHMIRCRLTTENLKSDSSNSPQQLRDNCFTAVMCYRFLLGLQCPFTGFIVWKLWFLHKPHTQKLSTCISCFGRKRLLAVLVFSAGVKMSDSSSITLLHLVTLSCQKQSRFDWFTVHACCF